MLGAHHSPHSVNAQRRALASPYALMPSGRLGAAHCACGAMHPCSGLLIARGGRGIRFHVAALQFVPIVLRLTIPHAGDINGPDEAQHRSAPAHEYRVF